MNNTEEGQRYPKILAVDFPDPDNPGDTQPAQAYVGTTLYSTDDNASNKLETDPAISERGAVVLPWVEPRAYVPEERVLITYEGTIGGERPGGFLKVGDSGAEPGLGSIEDGSARFCSAGVQGMELTRRVGEERFELSGNALSSFAEQYADYVQITQELLPSDDEYWKSASGQSCGGGRGYDICEQTFGRVEDTEELLPARELRIVAAFQDRLVVAPRNVRDTDAQQERMELTDCCFPSGMKYTVRASRQWTVRGTASGFRHRVVPSRVDTEQGVTFPCTFDCSAAKKYFESRAFEISEDSRLCNSVPVVPGQPGSECIFDSLTARFAIYAGREPSQRDMTFYYDLTGGFSALSISLTRNDTSIILPQTLTLVPGVDLLAAVDAQDRGLMLLSLDTLGVASPSPFF